MIHTSVVCFYFFVFWGCIASAVTTGDYRKGGALVAQGVWAPRRLGAIP